MDYLATFLRHAQKYGILNSRRIHLYSVMHLEIERKFLVKGEAFKAMATEKLVMVQAFLSTDPKRTVRVRKIEDQGWLTIKGISGEDGTTRREWEFPISGQEAGTLLEICLPGAIRKTRYRVPFKDLLFEVDEFHDLNQGLVLAEVELTDAAQKISLPPWIGQEVTGNAAYYNSQLSLKPYTQWKK